MCRRWNWLLHSSECRCTALPLGRDVLRPPCTVSAGSCCCCVYAMKGSRRLQFNCGIRQPRFTCITSDAVLPGLSGFTATRKAINTRIIIQRFTPAMLAHGGQYSTALIFIYLSHVEVSDSCPEGRNSINPAF